ncbi:NfeD family protein [Pseudomonas sp. LF245]
MWDFLQLLSFWDWLALGTVLLILEVFGAGGYLLWMGIAAAAVGVIKFLVPSLGLEWQLLLFAVLSLLTALAWWKRLRSSAKPSDQPGLNERGSELVGRIFVVHQPIIDGRGKVKVGDGVWMVTGPDSPVGAQVRVVGQDGVILKVETV